MVGWPAHSYSIRGGGRMDHARPDPAPICNYTNSFRNKALHLSVMNIGPTLSPTGKRQKRFFS